MTPDLTIYRAEDHGGHATLVRRNVNRAGLDTAPARGRNGQKLLDPFAAGPPALGTGRRVLILLDASMPKVDGLEVLRRLKSGPATAAGPIYIPTTPDNPPEVDRPGGFVAVTRMPGPPKRSDLVSA